VLAPPVVLEPSALTPLAVLRAGEVANERLITVGRVVVARGVVIERFMTVGRVVVAGGVVMSAS
jgi:hypothetical protein